MSPQISNCSFESSLRYTRKYLAFEKGNKQIRIFQVDWRDDYFIYRIEVNNKVVFEIDISNQGIDKAVDMTLSKLKEQL